MSRLALVAILVSVVFVAGASAEFWAVSLTFPPGTNCLFSGVESATVVKNDTCVDYTYSRFQCFPETQTYRAYPNCGNADVFTEYTLDTCRDPVPRRAPTPTTMYKCIEAASEAEALAFLSSPAELTMKTTTTTNNFLSCDSGVQEVKAVAPVCAATPIARKRETAAAYNTESCNSTHTLYYDCNDMACADCTLVDAIAFSCTVSEFSAQTGCLVIPALPAPPTEAPVAAPAEAPVVAPVEAPVAAAASPVAAPQGSASAPVAAAPNSAAQIAMSLAVVVASVLAVLF